MLHTDSISSIHKSSQVYSARDFVETPSSLVRSVSNSHPVKSSIPIYPIDRSRSPQHSVSRMDLSDLGPAQGLTPSPSFTLSSSPIASTSDNSSAILDTLSPEVDRKSCALLGSLAVGIQAFLGLAVLGSLLAKRAREHPRRPWNIWTMDISKQVVGQAFIHGSNLLISDVTSHRGANACGVYVSNILIDTTIGVFILYLQVPRCNVTYLVQAQLIRLRIPDSFSLRHGCSSPNAAYFICAQGGMANHRSSAIG